MGSPECTNSCSCSLSICISEIMTSPSIFIIIFLVLGQGHLPILKGSYLAPALQIGHRAPAWGLLECINLPSFSLSICIHEIMTFPLHFHYFLPWERDISLSSRTNMEPLTFKSRIEHPYMVLWNASTHCPTHFPIASVRS
jgi:hypothetical protein